MIDYIRKNYPQYDDMSDEDLAAAIQRKGIGQPNHENLDGPGVVTASTSHELQRVAPDLKPVVKGTKAEVLRMKQTGQVGPGNIVHIGKNGEAYIINVSAVQELYGASPQQSLRMARQDIDDGGEMESILLGYPKREGVENPTTAAVDRDGNVITDLPEMKAKAEAGDVIWAGEGNPAEAQQMAETIGNRWKTIGEENAHDEETADQEDTEGGSTEAYNAENAQDAEVQVKGDGAVSRPAVNQGKKHGGRG